MDIVLVIDCAIYPVTLELDCDIAVMFILYVPTGTPEGTIMDLPSGVIPHPLIISEDSLSMENVIISPLAQLEELAIVTVCEVVVAVPGVDALTVQQLPL